MQFAGLNTLDLLLVIVLMLGILIGIIRGVLTQIISIVSIWLGLVATLWLYKIFSFRILQGLGLSETGSDTLAFLILLIVFFNAFRLIVHMLSTPPEERRRKKKATDDPLAEAARTTFERFIIGPLKVVFGMVMGFILTTLWLAIILGALQFIFQPTDFSIEHTGFARRMVTNLRTSTLVPWFNVVLSWLVTSLNLFTPRDADILRRVIELIR